MLSRSIIKQRVRFPSSPQAQRISLSKSDRRPGHPQNARLPNVHLSTFRRASFAINVFRTSTDPSFTCATHTYQLSTFPNSFRRARVHVYCGNASTVDSTLFQCHTSTRRWYMQAPTTSHISRRMNFRPDSHLTQEHRTAGPVVYASSRIRF